MIKNDFNIDSVFSKSVNPLVDMESVSTDFVTNNLLGNNEYRFNFYSIIQSLFDIYKKKLMVNEFLPYVDNVFLIFKGGNIIKSIIDTSEHNIIKDEDYSLNEFSKTKRSDSDFGIIIEYEKILKNFQNERDKKIFQIKILLICETISYNILNYIRTYYDIKTETILFNDNNIKITNLNENLNQLNNLFKSYEKSYENLIKNTFDKKIDDPFRNSQKNIANDMFNLLSIEYNNKIDTNEMPKLIGFVINNYVYHNINSSVINSNNCISLKKLSTIFLDTPLSSVNNNINILDNSRDNIEVNFGYNGHFLISDDDSLKYARDTGKIYGYDLGESSHVLDKIKMINSLDLINNKKEINQIINTSTKNDKPIYISINRTVRNISNDNKITAFNLLRCKYNIRLFFKLSKPIKQYQYVYINLPGEFIDISITLMDDYHGSIIYKNVKTFFTTKTVVDNNNIKSLKICTYSLYGLIHDIQSILFDETDNAPWNDQKYAKRLERLFRLYYAYIKDVYFINDSVQIILNAFLLQLESSLNLYKSFIDTKNVDTLNIINNIFINSEQIINSTHKDIQLKDNDDKINNNIDIYNLLLEMFETIKKPFIKFNKITKDDLTYISNSDHLISYLNECIKYYKIFINNITNESISNLNKISLGGYYNKYLKYKHKYLKFKKLLK